MTYTPGGIAPTAGALVDANGIKVFQNSVAVMTTLGALRTYINGTVAPIETMTINSIGAQTVGTVFGVSGTYANTATFAPDYSLDNGATWAPASTPSVSATGYSFSLTLNTVNTAQTVMVRDRSAQSVTATSPAFAVAAAPVVVPGQGSGTALVASAPVRVSVGAESPSSTAVTSAGPTITIFDATVWSLLPEAAPSTRFMVARNGVTVKTNNGTGITNTSNVTTLLYFDGKVYHGIFASNDGYASKNDATWYTNGGSGQDWYIVGGDPRVLWQVGEPRAPNRPIPYGLGIKAQNPGGGASNIAHWESDLARFTLLIGKPAYVGAFINFGLPISGWAADAAGTAADWARTPSSTNVIPVVGFPMATNDHFYDTMITVGGVSRHSNSVQFDEFAAGTWDSAITGIANGWLDNFNTVYFRPGYEFDGGFMPWFQGKDTTTQASFVAAYKRIYTVLHAAATAHSGTKTVQVMWNPASINFTDLDTSGSYPGDAFVDLLGLDTYSPVYSLDLYNWADVTKGQLANKAQFAANAINRQHYWDWPAGKQDAPNGGDSTAGMQKMLAFAKAHGKDICIPETGAGNGYPDIGPVDEGMFPTWLRSRLDQFKGGGGNCRFVLIWPTRQSDGQWGFLDPYEKPQEALAWSAGFGGGGTATINTQVSAATPAPGSPAATFTESPSNTVITGPGPVFTTATGLVFSLIIGADNTLHVAVGGVDNGITHDVTTLLYYLGNVYHKNATSWFQRNADGSWTLLPGGDPRGAVVPESASGTVLNSTTGSITDGTGKVYTLINGETGFFHVAVAGADDGATSFVIQMVYFMHELYVQDHNGWYWRVNSTNYVHLAGDPRVLAKLIIFNNTAGQATMVAADTSGNLYINPNITLQTAVFPPVNTTLSVEVDLNAVAGTPGAWNLSPLDTTKAAAITVTRNGLNLNASGFPIINYKSGDAALPSAGGTTTTFGAYGIPSRGMGITGYPGDVGFPAEYDATTGVNGINMVPTNIGTSPGTFDSLTNLVHYNDQHAASYAIEPRMNGGLGGSKIIPVLGMTNYTTTGDFTFASVLTGVNDAQLQAYVASWMTRGFKEIWVRIGYEDNFPTTPASQNADHGAFVFTGPLVNGVVQWPPSATAADGGAAYKAAYLQAWRRVARVMHAAAISGGGVCKTIWGPTFINSCPLDGRTFYPDSDQTDGFGKQVDFHGPDLYSNQFYGRFVTLDNVNYPLRSGYANKPPFTQYAADGNAASVTAWAKDRGSKWYALDYLDGNDTNAAGWGGGWSMFEAMNFALTCPSGPCPMLFPEHGVITNWDGGGNGGLNALVGDLTAGEDLDLAPYVRSRIAWFQQQGGNFLTPTLWRHMSPAMLHTYQAVFPELVTGYAGSTVSPGGTPQPLAQSPEGKTVTGPGQAIVDAGLVQWTLSGTLGAYDVMRAGVIVAGTTGSASISMWNGAVVIANAAGDGRKWNGTAFVAIAESASGTDVTTIGPVITANTGVMFALITDVRGNFGISVNGVADPVPWAVTDMLYYQRKLYHKNSSGQWAVRDNAGKWTVIAADPRVVIGNVVAKITGTNGVVYTITVTPNEYTAFRQNSHTYATGAPENTGIGTDIFIYAETINPAAGLLTFGPRDASLTTSIVLTKAGQSVQAVGFPSIVYN